MTEHEQSRYHRHRKVVDIFLPDEFVLQIVQCVRHDKDIEAFQLLPTMQTLILHIKHRL